MEGVKNGQKLNLAPPLILQKEKEKKKKNIFEKPPSVPQFLKTR